ncbi:sialic acid-binding Ig-like lectin 10 [Suncus etruscus]|uniref:sialic acid-binding Ig-like lectin 10 n=1 Tax=Suncus etruscus TaxID=109475 RepID=UPI0021109F3C|nr:sialic acid-binding Ig-like lectin 10 [Suncus etruscus]
MYYFRVENGESMKYSYTKSTVFLEVTDLMKPDIYILEPLWPNRWGTVNCVFNATFDQCPAPSFSWAGQVLSTSLFPVSTHRRSVLKISPRPQDQRIDLTCRVRFTPQGRIFEKTVRLDVAYAPKDLVIRVSQVKGAAPQSQGKGDPSFHLQAQQGSFLQLLCEASSHPPASLSWSLGDRVLWYSNPKDPRALALELPSVQARDTGNYTCRAENALGQKMSVVHLEVQYAPEDLSVMVSIENGTVLQTLQKANTLRVLQGQSLQLRCVARSSPPARLSWTRGPLPQSPVLPNELGLLLLPRMQPDQEGEYTCQAQNQLGSQQVSVTIHVYSPPPQLLGLHCSWETPALQCSCLAHGLPVPALRWWLGSKLLSENCSKASVQFSTQELWANSSLSLLKEFDPGLTLSCEAWNLHGAQMVQSCYCQVGVSVGDEKGTLRGAFSNGVLVGTGIAGFLCLCVILILVIFLRRRGKWTKQMSRRSTILDYVNIFPHSGSQSLSQGQGPLRKNPKQKQKLQQELPSSAGKHAEATPPQEASQDQEIQYSQLYFPGRRPQVLQAPNDSHEEYVEMRFLHPPCIPGRPSINSGSSAETGLGIRQPIRERDRERGRIHRPIRAESDFRHCLTQRGGVGGPREERRRAQANCPNASHESPAALPSDVEPDWSLCLSVWKKTRIPPPRPEGPLKGQAHKAPPTVVSPPTAASSPRTFQEKVLEGK